MSQTLHASCLWLAALVLAPQFCPAVTIEIVPVNDLGNADDSTGFGGVEYFYLIGKYEVTNDQYVEFLNAKAGEDPLELYNANMGFNALGGMLRTGASPNFTYEVKPGMGSKPVNWVTWFDSARFANWMHNGQGNGDTESGAYDLLGGTPTPANWSTRNPGASWFLTNQDEWYKAAYYDPSSSTYFDYPTASDLAPIAEVPPGGSNSANYDNVNGGPIDVGAYTLSSSPYGTFDQGGNVWDRIEDQVDITDSRPGVRGGTYQTLHPNSLKSTGETVSHWTTEGSTIGFRLATVPEPSTVVIAFIGLTSLIAFRIRRAR